MLNGAESRARLSDGGIPTRQRLRRVPHPHRERSRAIRAARNESPHTAVRDEETPHRRGDGLRANRGVVVMRRRETTRTSRPDPPAPRLRCRRASSDCTYRETIHGGVVPRERWDRLHLRDLRVSSRSAPHQAAAVLRPVHGRRVAGQWIAGCRCRCRPVARAVETRLTTPCRENVPHALPDSTTTAAPHSKTSLNRWCGCANARGVAPEHARAHRKLEHLPAGGAHARS